ncbi:Suppressor of Sensor Kinase (SLN1) [Coemansia sp. RSA 1365]|nr:Suppressor of Sensor Kinase (SLN1) [Coemansia sp. RSA 1365]
MDMDVENDAFAERTATNEFDGRVFYLYGYPTSQSSSYLGQYKIESAGAQGEELRRQYQARLKLTAALEAVGAQAITAEDKVIRPGLHVNNVVIPDSCSAEHRTAALEIGQPVISESALLDQIQKLHLEHSVKEHYTKENTNNANTTDQQLRSSVSLDEITTQQLNERRTVFAGLRYKPRALSMNYGDEKQHHRWHDMHSTSADDGADIETRSYASSSSSGSRSDPFELDDDEHRERMEWHQMLTSALCSQVVDGEKKRLDAQADSYLFNLSENEYAEHLSELLQSHEDREIYKNAHIELWLGCRAAIRGRTSERERQVLESLRAVHVEPALRAVMEFSADNVEPDGTGDFSAQCLGHVQKLLRRMDYVEGLYPTLRALGEAWPLYASQEFQDKLQAMTSWTNVSVRIEQLHAMVQRWTGSRKLNLFATSSSALSSTTVGITGNAAEVKTHTPFVERLLKENGITMIFERKMLWQLKAVMKAARYDVIANSAMIERLRLPETNRKLQELLMLSPRLLQTCLDIRLQSAANLFNPALAQVDQLIEDIRDSLLVACRVKRTFAAMAAPVQTWRPGVRLDAEYDRTMRNCLRTYFRLLLRKLRVTQGCGARDFEILENQWSFLFEIVRDIDGGQHELALRYCRLVRRSMRLWTSILAQRLAGPAAYDAMTSRELGKWLSRALQDVRSPILKAQRLVRTIQSALTNATDYAFDDALPVLAQLVDSKHVLVYTAGEWESRGVYIVGSQALLHKPQMARELLAACVMGDETASSMFRNCYLLVVRTDAEFNWTGPMVVPDVEGIPFQDLRLAPGQMRLIAPGFSRLERYRHWLERLNIAAERQPGQTYTAVTDEILGEGLGGDEASGDAEDELFADEPCGDGRREQFVDENYADTAEKGVADPAVGVCEGAGSDPHHAALRPSLEPFDRRLGRMNSPRWNAAARRGMIEDMTRRPSNQAQPDAKQPKQQPAHIIELNRAHNPHVQREWVRLKYSITQMLDALTQLPDMLRTLHLDVHERAYYEGRGRGVQTDAECVGANCGLLEQVQEAFLFVSNTSSRGARFLDLKAERYVRLALLYMCVGWCAFITEDCVAGERRTFRWAMQALEFTMSAGRGNTLQVLARDDWQLIKAQVAGCVTLMISHFDVLGTRADDLATQKRPRATPQTPSGPAALLSLDGVGAALRTHLAQRQRMQHAVAVDALRDAYLGGERRIGRVLETTALPEDQTLRLLAASSSNITLRWQIGRYIGGGAFGAVYVGYNLDTGEVMAVKEIRFPARPLQSAPRAASESDSAQHAGARIVREMEVMAMLQHPNVVSYYGIEVHREKVYLFMELCTRGSLAQVIKDQGRLDEPTARVFVVQMLRGLLYLHSAQICHRDIKCDNTLLDEYMSVKLVDFGAAKVLNQQLHATRRTRLDAASLTGTPMYMAPEVILSSNGGSVAAGSGPAREVLRPGRLGAQDIWALGCCVVEMITGSPPWAHLDNEWAIMYHVAAGDPPLPTASELSPACLRFIRRCFTRQPADRPDASELLQDEWLAACSRNMERLEAAHFAPGKLASGPFDYAANMDNLTDPDVIAGDVAAVCSSHRNVTDILSMNTSDSHAPHALASGSHMLSVGSAGSAPSPGSRSRRSSIHTKNLSGDLRFMNSVGSLSNAEVLLSMAGYSSAGFSPAAGSTASRQRVSTPRDQPLPGRSPSSPASVGSLHAAWPFNKVAASLSGAEAVSPVPELYSNPSSTSRSNIAGVQWNPLAATAGVGSASSHGLSVDHSSVSSDRLGPTEEELVAHYTSPSVVYQALSSPPSTSPVRATQPLGSAALVPPSRLHHTSEMGSPAGSVDSVDSVGAVSQFLADSSSSAHSSVHLSSAQPLIRETSADNSAVVADRLSPDNIQDISETTRKVVSTMLSIPLEGADVAGVSGWLGDANTPMGLLGIEEVRETLATTSQNVVRQREQQLRKLHESRHQLNQMTLQKRSMSEVLTVGPSVNDISKHRDPAPLTMPPQSDPGFRRQEIDTMPAMTEPPALYPLPPEEDIID